MSNERTLVEAERLALAAEDLAWGKNPQGPPQVDPDPLISQEVLEGLALGDAIIDADADGPGILQLPEVDYAEFTTAPTQAELDELEHLAAKLEADKPKLAVGELEDNLSIAIAVFDKQTKTQMLFYGRIIVSDGGAMAALEAYEKPPEPGCEGMLTIAGSPGDATEIDGTYDCTIGIVRADCTFDVHAPTLTTVPIPCYPEKERVRIRITSGLDGRASQTIRELTPTLEVREMRAGSTVRDIGEGPGIRDLPKDDDWDAEHSDEFDVTEISTADVRYWTEPFVPEEHGPDLKQAVLDDQLEVLVDDAAGGYIAYVVKGHEKSLLYSLEKRTTYVYTCNGHVIVLTNTTDKDDAYTTAFERFCDIYEVDPDGDVEATPGLDILIRQFAKAECVVIDDDESFVIANPEASSLQA